MQNYIDAICEENFYKPAWPLGVSNMVVGLKSNSLFNISDVGNDKI